MSKTEDNARSADEQRRRHERELEGGAAGALAGAAAGALAGPPGIAVGAVVGAIAGAITGGAAGDEAASVADEGRKLDREIGVTEGELGAPDLDHPPAKVGAYSSAAAGTSASTEDKSADGPIPTPE